jgi:phosphatidylglycerol---prolipoprotein diacylglyceryl transferase
MMRTLFHVPLLGLPIYGYGLMMVLGLLAGVWLAGRLCRSVGLNPDDFVNAGILALLSGIVGARISHVFENFSTYTDPSRSGWQNFLAAINITSGGLTYYGGFIFATVTLIIWGKLKKIPIPLGMDVIAPALMVGLAFGRIGCLLNGCCWGPECDLPWAIHYPMSSDVYQDELRSGERTLPPELALTDPRTGQIYAMPQNRIDADPKLKAIASHERSYARHPTQIYSTILALLVAAVCTAYFYLPHLAGRGFALMLVLEGIARFTLETLRVEPAVLGRLSYSMVISIGNVAAGLALWFVFGKLARRVEPLTPPTATPAAA